MFKRRSAILILISAFLVGGYLNSEATEKHLSTFTYISELPSESSINCYFCDVSYNPFADNTVQLKLDTLEEPQYYLVIEKFNDVRVALKFTPLKYGSYDPIPYNVDVTNEQDSSESYLVSVSGEDGNTNFSIPLLDGFSGKSVYRTRTVYGFIYNFDETDISNASPGTYESTVTVTVTEGS